MIQMLKTWRLMKSRSMIHHLWDNKVVIFHQKHLIINLQSKPTHLKNYHHQNLQKIIPKLFYNQERYQRTDKHQLKKESQKLQIKNRSYKANPETSKYIFFFFFGSIFLDKLVYFIEVYFMDQHMIHERTTSLI